jgi:hypothetical protein
MWGSQSSWALVPGVLIAVVYEIVIGIIVAAGKRRHIKVPLGGFEWTDIACYVGGGLIALALLAFWRWKLLRDLPGAIQRDARRTQVNAQVTTAKRQDAERRRRRPKRR